MPPRKSNVSTVSTAAEETSMLTENGSDGKAGGAGDSQAKAVNRKKKEDVAATTASASAEQSQLGIDEFMMPRMMTVRLAKGVLPPQTLIHRDAATALQYAASVFLNHVAAAANEHTLSSQRKNISPHDMLLGLKDTEWGGLVPQLEEELAIYVRQINDKRNEYRRKLKERGSLGAAGGVEGAGLADAAAEAGVDDEDLGEEDVADITATSSSPATARGDGAPRAKKARLSEGVKQDDEMDEDLPEDEEEEEEEEDADEDEDEEEADGPDEEEDGEEDEDGADDRTSERDEEEDEEEEEEEEDSD